MSNANDEFLAAFQNIEIITPVIEHRVYFDPITGRCTFNTTMDEPGEYIVVTREEYDKVEFAPNWFVTKTNKLRRIKLDLHQTKKLQLSDSGFTTIKDNNIFVLNEEQPNTDKWNLKVNE